MKYCDIRTQFINLSVENQVDLSNYIKWACISTLLTGFVIAIIPYIELPKESVVIKNTMFYFVHYVLSIGFIFFCMSFIMLLINITLLYFEDVKKYAVVKPLFKRKSGTFMALALPICTLFFLAQKGYPLMIDIVFSGALLATACANFKAIQYMHILHDRFKAEYPLSFFIKLNEEKKDVFR